MQILFFHKENNLMRQNEFKKRFLSTFEMTPKVFGEWKIEAALPPRFSIPMTHSGHFELREKSNFKRIDFINLFNPYQSTQNQFLSKFVNSLS